MNRELKDKMKKDRISMYKVEKYITNRLSAEESAELEKQLDENPSLKKSIDDYSNLSTQKNFNELFGTQFDSVESSGGFWSFFMQPFTQFGIMAALIAVLGTNLYFNFQQQVIDESNYAAKGNVVLNVSVNSIEIEDGKITQAAPNDTIKFALLSAKPTYIQVWYRDDNQVPQPYLSMEGSAILQKAAHSMKELSKSIVLDSNWNKEELMVFYSDRDFTLDSGSVLRSFGDSIRVQRFFLERSDIIK